MTHAYPAYCECHFTVNAETEYFESAISVCSFHEHLAHDLPLLFSTVQEETVQMTLFMQAAKETALSKGEPDVDNFALAIPERDESNVLKPELAHDKASVQETDGIKLRTDELLAAWRAEYVTGREKIANPK